MRENRLSEGEIDLLNVMRIFWRRKEEIFIYLLLSLAVATAYFFYSPKVYEVYSLIRVGVISEPLMTKTTAMETMSDEQFLLDTVSLMGRPLSTNELRKMLERRAITIRDANRPQCLKVVVKNRNIVLAKEICNAVSVSLVAAGRILFQKETLFLERRIKNDEEEKNAISGLLHALNQKLSKQPTTDCQAILEQFKELFEKKYTPLRKQLFSLKEELLNYNDFAVVEPATEARVDTEEKVNKALVIFNLCLILSIVFIYFQELRKNSMP